MGAPKRQVLPHRTGCCPQATPLRERLAEWVWSGRGPDRSGHNLQVAVSAVRRVIDLDGDRESSLLVRDGEGYRLALLADADSDVRRNGNT